MPGDGARLLRGEGGEPGWNSGADEAGVEAAGDGWVGGSLDYGAAVGEDAEGVGAGGEAEEHGVAADLAKRGEALAEGVEVEGAGAFVDLDGVAAAEGDVGAIFSGEVAEDALAADLAIGARGGGGDFRVLVGPEVPGEEGAAHLEDGAGKEFEGFGDLDAGGEVGGGVEDASGLAGFDPAGGRGGEEAGEAGGFAGEDVHAGGVGADGGGVNPGAILVNAEIVDEVAGLEVVGGVEDEVGAFEQGQGGGDEVGDVGGDGEVGVDGGEFAAGGFGFGEGVAGVGFVVEHLSLEVGLFDEVAIDEGEVADAGAGEQGCGGGSGGSAADDGDVGLGEPLLAFGADAGEEDLAGVAARGGDVGRILKHGVGHG
jgi:hypothetical protein